ncbi:peptide chain release factor 2 [Chloroflexota bacterium]
MQEDKSRIEDLQRRISEIMVHLDIPGNEKEIARLVKESGQPEFWQDTMSANQIMRQMSALKEETESWLELKKKVEELDELISLSLEEGDASLEQGIHSEVDQITTYLERMEFQLLLGGEYDKGDALLAIHAGAGGTDSQDWAEMLLRMYLRWAEKRNYQADLLDTSPGEEVGIKSAMLEIKGKYAYGYLKSEHGVHRLVRISPFDADHARHTSFAQVEVLPMADEEVDIKINPDDLKVDTFRSSGPGGQNVQKTSTAVRITHLPTGLVVPCQSQRSQHQNKEIALKVLYARLLEMEMAKRVEERAKLKGEHVSAAWGNQIRSYVLHPYKMVKDHRTGCEIGNATAVLDGELDELIEAYLRSQIGGEKQR